MPEPKQRYSKREAFTDSGEVVLDTDVNPRDMVEIWVKSTANVTFIVSGSSDGTNFHQTASLSVTAPTYEKTTGLSNAYRYVKVSTVGSGDHEVEIVAA